MVEWFRNFDMCINTAKACTLERVRLHVNRIHTCIISENPICPSLLYWHSFPELANCHSLHSIQQNLWEQVYISSYTAPPTKTGNLVIDLTEWHTILHYTVEMGLRWHTFSLIWKCKIRFQTSVVSSECRKKKGLSTNLWLHFFWFTTGLEYVQHIALIVCNLSYLLNIFSCNIYSSCEILRFYCSTQMTETRVCQDQDFYGLRPSQEQDYDKVRLSQEIHLKRSQGTILYSSIKSGLKPSVHSSFKE